MAARLARSCAFSNAVEETGFISLPIMEGAYVLFAIQGHAGRMVVKKWVERRGLQVQTVTNWDELAPALERIKHEVFSASFYFSERMDHRSTESHMYDSWLDELHVKNFPRSEPTSFDVCLQRFPSEGTRSAQRLDFFDAQAHLLLNCRC